MSDGKSFLSDVSQMFQQAADLISMEEGLANKINVCNASYTTRFGVRLNAFTLLTKRPFKGIIGPYCVPFYHQQCVA